MSIFEQLNYYDMNKLFLLIIPLIFYSCDVQKATIEEINKAKTIYIYKTTSDYINNPSVQTKAKAIFRKKSNQHIVINKVIDTNGFTFKNWNTVWAFNYEGNTYFNLRYSKSIERYKTFVKLDIEGKICLIIINENSPYFLKQVDNGLGAIGALAIGNIFWKDKKGKTKKILIIETDILAPSFGNRKEGSFAYYLSKGRMKDFIKENNIIINKKISDLYFEDVINIIKKQNKK